MKRVKKGGVHDHNGETLLHVYWTHLPAGSNASAHLVMTNKVSSDLSLEDAPDFTRREMQTIMFHARMGVREVMRQRRGVVARKAPPLRPRTEAATESKGVKGR